MIKPPVAIKKAAVYFVISAVIAFGLAFVAKTFVMSFIHYEYKIAYQKTALLLKNTYQNMLQNHPQPRKSILDAANRNIYQSHINPLPDVIIHYHNNHTPISIISKNNLSKSFLNRLHQEIKTHMDTPKTFHISSKTSLIFVTVKNVHPSMRSYAVFFDKTYLQKSLFVTTSFIGAYLVLMLILFVFLLTRAMKTPNNPIIQTPIHPPHATSFKLHNIEKFLLNDALQTHKKIISNTSTKNKIRKYNQILQDQISFEKQLDNIELLQKVHQRTYTTTKSNEVVHLFMSLVSHLHPSSKQINLYLKSPKEQYLFLAAQSQNQAITCYTDSFDNPQFLYSNVSDAGQCLLQKKRTIHTNENIQTIRIPFYENEINPILLQLEFPLHQTFTHQEFLFLKYLLKHLSQNLSNFNAIKQKQYHTNTQLLNEIHLHKDIIQAAQKLTLGDYKIRLCLLKIQPSMTKQPHDKAVVEIIEKHFASLLKKYRNIGLNAYHISTYAFCMLMTKENASDEDFQTKMTTLLKEMRQKNHIPFFNQKIDLHIQTGMAQIKPKEIEQKDLLQMATDDINNNTNTKTVTSPSQ